MARSLLFSCQWLRLHLINLLLLLTEVVVVTVVLYILSLVGIALMYTYFTEVSCSHAIILYATENIFLYLLQINSCSLNKFFISMTLYIPWYCCVHHCHCAILY